MESENGELPLVKLVKRASYPTDIINKWLEHCWFQVTVGKLETFPCSQMEYKLSICNIHKWLIIFRLNYKYQVVAILIDSFWLNSRNYCVVKQVKLKDMTTKETLKFDFNCWLSLRHTDATLMRELPAVRPAQDVLPGNWNKSSC